MFELCKYSQEKANATHTLTIEQHAPQIFQKFYISVFARSNNPPAIAKQKKKGLKQQSFYLSKCFVKVDGRQAGRRIFRVSCFIMFRILSSIVNETKIKFKENW